MLIFLSFESFLQVDAIANAFCTLYRQCLCFWLNEHANNL